mgnify:CR=1 FL=1
MTEDQREQMKALAQECGLTKEDFFKHQHYTIITRQGIEKIAAKKGIQLNYTCIAAREPYAAVKCNAHTEDLTAVQTPGSASKLNSHNNYYLEMAEKRAKSRAVLQLTNLYSYGVFGEDEADDFKRG